MRPLLSALALCLPLIGCNTTTTAPTTAAATGAAYAGATSADGYRQIATAAALAPVMNRRLDFKDGMYAVIRPDGTWSGKFATAMGGTWAMTDGYWCRTITQGAGSTQVHDCQKIEQKGNSLRFTRDRGAGQSFEYTVGAPA